MKIPVKTSQYGKLGSAFLLLVAVNCFICESIVAAGAMVYVAVDGLDENDGSFERPMKTIPSAITKLRKMRADNPKVERHLVLRKGVYHIDGIDLTAADSGTAEIPFIIESHADETARLVHGRGVALDRFKPVTSAELLSRIDPAAKGKIVQLDLKQNGIGDVEPLPDVFSGQGNIIQLYCNGKRLPLSRWPDGGYVTMKSVIDSGIEPAPHGGAFEYSGDRPEHWATALETGGVWLMGFWRVPWTVQAIRVASIDPAKKTITFAAPISQGIGSKYTPLVNGTRKGDGKEPWYAMNLLEEITRPGEWSIDFSTSTLFLWPPADSTQAEIVVSESPKPAITLKSVSHVQLRRIALEGGINEAIQIQNGDNVSVLGCTIRDTGGAGIKVSGGSSILIDSCDLSAIGAEGIVLNSGKRETLTVGSSRVVNNHISHTGQVSGTVYAVILEGVGNTVANNLIHDVPIGGIQYGGNDHIIEKNELHNLGLDAGDVGAIYTNGDWASRGNVIRNNLIHHALGVNAIYIDDGHSGDMIRNNIVYRVGSGLFIGGGHDNIGDGNLIIECPIGIHLDDRGLARGYTIDSTGALTRFLRTIKHEAEPWRSRYPDLARMLSEPSALPRPTGNRFAGNALVDCELSMRLSGKSNFEKENVLSPNFVGTAAQAGLSGMNSLNFMLKDVGGVLRQIAKFEKPAVETIGVYMNEYRNSLPSAEETGRYKSRPPRKVFDSQVDIDATNRKH